MADVSDETPRRRGPGRRPRPEARRNRGRILHAADRLVAQHGRGVTLATIASAARLSVPSIHRNFGSKDGLLDALLDHAVERCRRGLQAHLDMVQTGVLPKGRLPGEWFGVMWRWLRPGTTLGNLLVPPDGYARLPAIAERLWPAVASTYPQGPQPWGDPLTFPDLVHLALMMAHCEGLGETGRAAIAHGIRHGLTGRDPSDPPDRRRIEYAPLAYDDLADDPDDPYPPDVVIPA